MGRLKEAAAAAGPDQWIRGWGLDPKKTIGRTPGALHRDSMNFCTSGSRSR